MHRFKAGLLTAAALLVPALLRASTGPERFESPHVHPLELSADGTRLFAVNTDDHRLAVFDVTPAGAPVLVAEIPVGLEPVTVRARGNSVWVVNHISDSISIIDLATGNVVKTLLVGDEPSDVVFAGIPLRAFVSVSQEDMIRVYDAAAPGSILAAIPLSGSEPRSLAVKGDGSAVYATAVESGNRTSIVGAQTVNSTLGPPPSNPPMNPSLPPAPQVALIVRHDGTNWVDEIGRSWNFALPFQPLDHDLFEINATSLAVTRTVAGVGTTVLNAAVNPVTGLLHVTNQEASNHIRFEPNLSGRFARSRVSMVNPTTGSVVSADLNPHIDLGNPAGSPAERAQSLAFPMDVAVRGNGQKVYVAAMSSGKVGVLDAGGAILSRIDVGAGPSGLALDETRGRLYVLNRIDHTISTVDLLSETETGTVRLGFDPVSSDLRAGQRLFYDAQNSSSHGDLSCATCHLFVGMDNLSWDLGSPVGSFQPAPPNQPGSAGFHPMKGPMTTQSLKGLSTTEPFHWRGDRAGLSDFNPAFVALLGRSVQLPPQDLNRFNDFVFSVRYPPSPFRGLANDLPNPSSGPNPTTGLSLFLTGNLVGQVQCVNCHTLPTGANGAIIPAALLRESQDMKVPQLRNLYEKTRFDNTGTTSVRGFGYTHDGAVTNLFTFLQFPDFTFRNNTEREHVASFLMAFDTGTHAGVGASWTMDGTNESAGLGRVTSLISQADQNRLGLIAKGRDETGVARGWAYQAGSWTSDRQTESTFALQDLLGLAGPGHEVTFTAVLEGCETRMGIDRDRDGYRDRDELDAGSDPADPAVTPANVGVPDSGFTTSMLLAPPSPNPVGTGSTRLLYTLRMSGPVRLSIVDVVGRLVRDLVPGSEETAGTHEAAWDLHDDRGRRVGSGVYLARLWTEQGVEGRRLIVLP